MLQQSRLTESAQLEQQQDLLQRRANTNLSRLHIVSSTSTRRRRNDVVRAKSPEGRRYLKPVNGIRTKGFAQSAQRRSSVVTLGPIERLQHFYAKRELKVNKGGILGFGQDSVMRTATGGGETETGIIVNNNNNNNNNNDDDVDDDDDECLESPPPRPSWMDLDVETDLDVLIGYCFRDIQTTLRTWCLVTGASDLSDSSDTEGGFFCDLPELVQSVTRMMESVRNYAFHRHDLSDTALRKLRYAGLELTGVLKDLEFRHGTMNDDEGYTFNQLREHQDAVLKYLAVVEEHVFNPPHHIGRPSPGLSPEIRALINNKIDCAQKHQPPPSIPLWLDPHAFVNDPMGRYHALLRDNYQSILEDALLDAELPDPHQDEEAFLAQLADGRILCTVYNNIVKRSRRPFGFINKIHHDTTRTFRVTENLRFFSAACKFRFDLVLHSFDPAEVARKTDTGFFMLKQAVEAFCDCVLAELRQDAVIKAQEAGLSQYMEKALFGGRNSDQHLPL